MAQVTLGAAVVSYGSTAVIGTGTNWSTTVAAGDLFAMRGAGVWEVVASVVDDTHLTLEAPYSGPTVATPAPYEVQTSFSPTQGYPLPGYGDNDTASLIAMALLKIDGQLTALSAVAAAMQGDLTLTGDLDVSVEGGVTTSSPDGLLLEVTGPGPIVFEVDAAEVARFDASGRLGIGTSLPGVALDVVGDAHLTGALAVASLSIGGAPSVAVPPPTPAQIGLHLTVVSDGNGGATLAYQ